MGSRAESAAKRTRTQELLNSLSEIAIYDPTTGIFTWRPKHGYKGALLQRSGKPMGCIDPMGYVMLSVCGVRVRGHQAAWAISNGKWPDGEIDHINGNRSDNRLSNLRDVPRFINCQNRRKASSTSRTGLLGTHWSAASKKYTAQIGCLGFRRHLGLFDTAEEAHAAYLAAKRRIHEGCTL